LNLALFDFDGTLTNGDTYSPFVRLAASPTRLLLGTLLIGPVILAYRRGVLPATAARRIVSRVAFFGEPEPQLKLIGRQYATDVLPGTLRAGAMERLAWHRSRGDEVAIVSASLDVYMEPWCASHGLHCISTQLQIRNGRYTGRYVRTDCCCAEKARRVRERFDLGIYPLIYAYGDSHEDDAMLELAHRRFYRGREVSTNQDAV
jgi:phosphatidylglycerophosphatase C